MPDRSTVTSSTVTGSAAGVVTRRTLPAPADATVYELTGAGRALQPALHELLHWGLRYGPEPSPGRRGPARLGTARRRGPAGRTACRAVKPRAAALSAPSLARRSAPTRPTRTSRLSKPRWSRPSASATSKKSPDQSSNGHPNCP